MGKPIYAIDVRLPGTVTALTFGNVATGAAPSRLGNQHASIAPYDTYDAADGVLILAVGNDEQWRRLCTVTGPVTFARLATGTVITTGSSPNRDGAA